MRCVLSVLTAFMLFGATPSPSEAQVPILPLVDPDGQIALFRQLFDEEVARERELRSEYDDTRRRGDEAHRAYTAAVANDEETLIGGELEFQAAEALVEQRGREWDAAEERFQLLRGQSRATLSQVQRAALERETSEARDARDAARRAYFAAEAARDRARFARSLRPTDTNVPLYQEFLAANAAMTVLAREIANQEIVVDLAYRAWLDALANAPRPVTLTSVTIRLDDRRLYSGQWRAAASEGSVAGAAAPEGLQQALTETIARLDGEIAEIDAVLRESSLARSGMLGRLQVATWLYNENIPWTTYTRYAEIAVPALIDIAAVLLLGTYSGDVPMDDEQMAQLARRAVARWRDANGGVGRSLGVASEGVGTAFGKGVAGVILEDEWLDRAGVLHGMVPILDNGGASTLLGDLIELAAQAGVQTAITPSELRPVLGGTGFQNYRANLNAGGASILVSQIKTVAGMLIRELRIMADQNLADVSADYVAANIEYQIALRADRWMEEERVRLYAQRAAAQFWLTAGDLPLALEQDVVPILQTEAGDRVVAELRFSGVLSQAPTVTLEGVTMAVRGNGARWLAELPVSYLTQLDGDTNARLDLSVSLATENTPYPQLDADPSTAVEFDFEQQGWFGVEEGPDRHHYIAYQRLEFFSGIWVDQYGAVVSIDLENEAPEVPASDGVVYSYEATLMHPGDYWSDFPYAEDDPVFAFRSGEGPTLHGEGEVFFRHRQEIQAGCGTSVVPLDARLFYSAPDDELGVFFTERYISSAEECAVTDSVGRYHNWTRLSGREYQERFQTPLWSGE